MKKNINGIRNIKLWTIIPLLVPLLALNLVLDFRDYLFQAGLILLVLAWVFIQLTRKGVSLSQIRDRSAKVPWMKVLFFVPFVQLAASASLLTIGMGIIYFFPEISAAPVAADSGETAHQPVDWLFRFAFVVVLGPIAEEYFFRGVVLNKWRLKYGVFRGVLFTSLVFGILHLDAFINAFLLSFLFSSLYIRTKRIIVPITVHIFANLLFFLVDWFLSLSPVQEGQAITDIPSSANMIATASVTLLLLSVTLYGLYRLYPKKNGKLAYR